MLRVINSHDILRVIAAFPLDADFSSRSAEIRRALKEDDRPLAKLTHTALISALTDPEGKSIISMLKPAAKRQLDNDGDGDGDGDHNRKRMNLGTGGRGKGRRGVNSG
jgi:hypothetical protein